MSWKSLIVLAASLGLGCADSTCADLKCASDVIDATTDASSSTPTCVGGPSEVVSCPAGVCFAAPVRCDDKAGSVGVRCGPIACASPCLCVDSEHGSCDCHR